MKLKDYKRKTFIVEGIQVTEENMFEVAVWCDGLIIQPTRPNDSAFIKVRVHRPLSERQTKAFVGDWILKTKNSYKVYPDKAFKASFEEHLEEGGWPVSHEAAIKILNNGIH
jgi:hypothetical protein